jgi:uncharacterized membrane protein
MRSSLPRLFNRLTAVHKLVISLITAALAFWIIPFDVSSALVHAIFFWDVFSLCLLVLTWITFWKTPSREIRQQAKKQDDTQVVIFFLVLIATCFSMAAVVLILISSQSGSTNKPLELSTAIACMGLSWFLVHTIFTSRYAHLYYADHREIENQDAGGLDFPGEEKPDFLDFAYFSFTLGMTFQVSDVEINSRGLRRLALGHGLLSFGYNATIIALTVNIIAGLIQG